LNTDIDLSCPTVIDSRRRGKNTEEQEQSVDEATDDASGTVPGAQSGTFGGLFAEGMFPPSFLTLSY
jgi:hypothetical protein